MSSFVKKIISLISVATIFIVATSIYMYLIPDRGFTFFVHPKWASWLFGVLLFLSCFLILFCFQFFKTYRSYLSSQENVCSMAQMHQNSCELSSAKSNFLATISHEVRNPLQAILGTHELLIKDNTISRQSKVLIQGAYNTSKSIVEMLNQVLDLSKIESGKIMLIQEPVSLRELLIQLTQSFQGLCNKRSNVLKIHFDGVIAPSLLIDSTRLKQILANLLSNSIKFTHHGLIYLTVTVLNDTHAEQLIQFQVIDTGCGIPEEDLERIIEPYQRSEDSHHQAVPGTGLGLSITTAILRSMDSHLSIDSNPNLGTSAGFRLRLKRSSSLPLSHYQEVIKTKIDIHENYFSGKTALIVDDYPACREIISRQLSYFGFRCFQAEHAQAGLIIMGQQTIDLVITDEFMPEITGRKFASQINTQYPLAKIIILTGDTQFVGKLEAEELNIISACMIKPIELPDFFQSLVKIFTSDRVRWDFNRLLDFANHNEEAAKSILQSILKTQKDLAQELHLQLHHTDLSILTPLCHKILGGAKLINAQFLINHCQTLQKSEKEFDQDTVNLIYQEILVLNKQMQDFLQLKNSYMI